MSTPRRLSAIILPVALGLALTLGGATQSTAAQAPVGLGSAGSYAVLAGSTVTNTGPSTLNAAVGVSPGSAITGFPPGLLSGGTIHSADSAAAQAQAAVTTAYNDAAGRTTSATVTADLGGQTLVAGVYTGGSLAITGTLILDGKGDPNSVFVFQAASSLTTASSSKVSLINGASSCNVFWLVTSSATLGTNSTFVGTVLALASITATTGASISGHLFARNGAVTLDSNNVKSSACSSSTTGTTGATHTTPSVPGRPLPGTGKASTVTIKAALLVTVLGGLTLLAVRRSPRRNQL